MPQPSAAARSATREEVVDRVRAIAPKLAARAAAAEEARRLPAESIQDLFDAGIARVLMPPRFGGYGLGFDTWFDIILEISKADASHGWCAGLITHHCHMIGQFPEGAQRAVWADGPDVAIAASVAPVTQVTRVDGGYRVSGQNSAFASGVDHCAWSMIGGLVPDPTAPEWVLFAIPSRDYQIRDTWFTAGMRATGSKTIVTDNVFVPDGCVLRWSDLRRGQGPGGALNEHPIFRTPFYFYAPLTFVTPMLGAARGAYDKVRELTRTRRAGDGTAVAEKASMQARLARAAADLDAAELLLRRAVHAPEAPPAAWPALLARSIRDFARSAELVVEAMDALMAVSGSAGFATAHAIQRAWRDVHFAATHISLNTETNYTNFGRMELGLPPDQTRPFF